ncbi:hypothetical protein J1614_011519 [Plenodomus biglobosus]|nr:hypothetical protein J1614_011519 [Plenodomus biglobosus]
MHGQSIHITAAWWLDISLENRSLSVLVAIFQHGANYNVHPDVEERSDFVTRLHHWNGSIYSGKHCFFSDDHWALFAFRVDCTIVRSPLGGPYSGTVHTRLSRESGGGKSGSRDAIPNKDSIKDIQDAPDLIQQIRAEICALQGTLSSLEFLTEADAQTLNEVKKTGVSAAMKECGKACGDLQILLNKWIRHGLEGLRDKIRIRGNKAKLTKNRTLILSARQQIDLSINRKVMFAERSNHEKFAKLEELKQEVREWQVIAEQEHTRVSTEIEALVDSNDDDDDERVLDELRPEKEILERSLKSVPVPRPSWKN